VARPRRGSQDRPRGSTSTAAAPTPFGAARVHGPHSPQSSASSSRHVHKRIMECLAKCSRQIRTCADVGEVLGRNRKRQKRQSGQSGQRGQRGQRDTGPVPRTPGNWNGPSEFRTSPRERKRNEHTKQANETNASWIGRKAAKSCCNTQACAASCGVAIVAIRLRLGVLPMRHGKPTTHTRVLRRE